MTTASSYEAVLADRDAIRVANLSPMYYSTERLARIEPFPNEENVFCPRCKSLIAPVPKIVSSPSRHATFV